MKKLIYVLGVIAVITILVLPASSVSPPKMNSFRFRIEIEGRTVAIASEVIGLQRETEVESYDHGSYIGLYHSIRKRQYPHIILKRGISSDELWEWYQDVLSGKFERKSGAIILMGPHGEDRYRWTFVYAIPVKWTGPDFLPGSKTVAFESVELLTHGVFREGTVLP